MKKNRIIIFTGKNDKENPAGISEIISNAGKKIKNEVSFLIVTTEKITSLNPEGKNLFETTPILNNFDGEGWDAVIPAEGIKNLGSILNLLQQESKNFPDQKVYYSIAEPQKGFGVLLSRIRRTFDADSLPTGFYVMPRFRSKQLLEGASANDLQESDTLAYRAAFEQFPIQSFKFSQKNQEQKIKPFLFLKNWKAKFDWFFSVPMRSIKRNGIKPLELISNGNHSLFRGLFFSTLIFLSFFLPVLSFDYGITMDEPEDHSYFVKVLDFFLSMGEDKSCLDINYKVNSHLINYGPFVNLLCVIAHKYISPFGLYETRHLVISLFSVVGLLFAGLTARKLTNWSGAWITVLFLLFTPAWLGHSMNNQKDLPFAALFIASVYFILKLVKELPRPSARTWVYATIAFGITMSIRIGGLLVLAFTGLFFVLFVLSRFRNQAIGQTIKQGLGLLIKLLAVTGIAYGIGIAFWPYALEAPIENPLNALKSFEKFSLVHIWELFEGKRYYMKDFPWYYIPKSMAITIPLFVQLGLVCFVLGMPVLWKRKKFSFAMMLTFVSLFPIAYIIYKGSVVYSSWRHVLFVYPPLVVLSVAGFQAVSAYMKNNGLRIAMLITGIALFGKTGAWVFMNHPYQYVYYNEWVGGLKGAYGNYETDYWCQSPRTAIEWLCENGHLPPGKKTTVVSNNVSASVQNYVPAECGDSVVAIWTREMEWNKNEWDYGIFTTRTLSPTMIKEKHFPPKGTIHVIETDGVPLAAIVKRENKSVPKAYNLMNQGNLNAADSLLRDALAYDPQNEEAWRLLGAGLLNQNRLREGMEALKKAIELFPENSYAYTYKGYIYTRLEKEDSAWTAFQAAAKFRPNNNLAYEGLGDICANRKDFILAVQYYETALGYNGNSEQAMDKIGRANFSLYAQNPSVGTKYLEQALNWFNAALQKNPKNPNYYYNVGFVLDKMGRKEQSQKYLDEYRKLSGR